MISAAPLLALAQAAVGQGDPLELYVEHRGGPGASAAAGDLFLEGTLEVAGRRAPFRSYVRRDPFGLREEFGPQGAAGVFVTDGLVAWELAPDGSSRPLSGDEAVSLLEVAFTARLGFLEPGRAQGEVIDERALPPAPAGLDEIPREAVCAGVRVVGASALPWIYFFDREDGRLHGICAALDPARRWTRFGGWRRFGPLTLPTVRADGGAGAPGAQVQRIDSVSTGLAHDPALFRGSPEAELPAFADVALLVLTTAPFPGSAYLGVPNVELQGLGGSTALLDLGITEIGVDAGWAAQLGIETRGADLVTTMTGDSTLGLAFLDRLDLEDLALFHLPAVVFPFAQLAEIPAAANPRVHLGGSRLMASAPVLDLTRGRLLLRRVPAAPLEELGRGAGEAGRAAPHVIRVPAREAQPTASVLAVEVSVPGGEGRASVLFDTGLPLVLRITPRGLGKLGLPAEREFWLARGALPLSVGGAGGGVHADLVARLDALAFGPVVYERPWVLIAGEDGRDEPGGDGFLGTGALLPFARTGIDPVRGVIELELPAGASLDANGRFAVPPPGEFLGLGLLAADPWTQGPEALPSAYFYSSGGPAERAGVREGDLIAAIDGASLRGVPSHELCRRLWVPEGGAVALLLLRAGVEQPIEVRVDP